MEIPNILEYIVIGLDWIRNLINSISPLNPILNYAILAGVLGFFIKRATWNKLTETIYWIIISGILFLILYFVV